jgi:hypothetical protein
MRNRFLLFGEKPFEVFVAERFSEIGADVQKMSDVEVLMYRETFDELVSKTLDSYLFPDLEICFEDQMVDLVEKAGHRKPRYFVEYSLAVKGNPYFLGLSPYVSGYRPLDLFVLSKKNFLSFEIDTGHHSEELTPAVTMAVRREYERIKQYITTAEKMLNETIAFHNEEMKEFLTHQLANKMRKAERCLKIRESLNFK